MGCLRWIGTSLSGQGLSGCLLGLPSFTAVMLVDVACYSIDRFLNINAYCSKVNENWDDYPIAISNDAQDGTVQSMVATIHSKRQRSGPLATDSQNLPDFVDY